MYVYKECITLASEASLASRQSHGFDGTDVSRRLVVESTLLRNIIRMVLLVIVCLYMYVYKK